MPMPDRALEGALLAAGRDTASGKALSPDEFAGLRKIVDLLRPLLAEVDPSLAASVQADLSALDRASAAGAGLHDAKMALVRDLRAMRTALRVEGDGTEP
jgi:hypothetical protein